MRNAASESDIAASTSSDRNRDELRLGTHSGVTVAAHKVLRSLRVCMSILIHLI